MMTKRMASVVALAISMMTAGPAMADTFTFVFKAPLSNGDTASGSGTLTTAAPDASGRWLIQSVLGEYRGYASQVQPNAITNVKGVTGSYELGNLVFGSPYLFKDTSGAIRTDGLAFYNQFLFDGIIFNQRSGGTYQGYSGEVSVQSATLTFADAAVTAAPEPATWAMMILGFGVIGAALRRRRTVTTRVAFG